MTKKKIFAFDLGKTSMGICIRDGHDIKDLKSLIIPAEFADVSEKSKLRRTHRQRDAHKRREKSFKSLWINAGLKEINSDDPKILREFPSKEDNTIYNSCLLRIMLLQNKPMEIWQIYKALFNAIQRRGYDKNIPWASKRVESKKDGNKDNKDDEDNKNSLENYEKELKKSISDEKYQYPCYFDALLMELWNYENPDHLKPRINHLAGKARDKGRVAPRDLVEKELRQLFDNAKKQISELNSIDTNYFLYGEGLKAYATNPDKKTGFKKYYGKEYKIEQGVLSQKMPRFDNRVISKCSLMPKRNVCRAKSIENIEFVILMGLKNLRYTSTSGEKKALSSEQVRKIYVDNINNVKEKNKINKTDITKFLKGMEFRHLKMILKLLKLKLSVGQVFADQL